MNINKKYKDKVCPNCYRLMKPAVVAGKNVWICVSCGIKTEAAPE